MNRQYIGARYVPKIFDNNGSSDWVSGIPYEALVIVTDYNNSYTSCKPVPKNIGRPSQNPDYWVCTGNFNAQLAEAVAKVDEFEERLREIVVNIEDYKTDNNTYNDAFELAYQALPTYGGTIYIPNMIQINRSINLYDMAEEFGVKKVLIKGNYTNLNNPYTRYNSVIVKTGNFDAVILANGCGMEHIGVSSTHDFTDTHDGIWVWGITCFLTDVGVNDQGGNGIRVGNKTGFEVRNCNIASLNTVRCVHNDGWGLFIEDSLHPEYNTSDANAGVYVALDIRDNGTGGIYLNNCIDNWFYSPDVEVNHGEAGIKIDNAHGIHIYSPFEENDTTYGIWLTSNSTRCIINGYRCGVMNSTITNEGSGNYILQYFGAKFTEPFISTPIALKAYKIANEDSNGFFECKVENYDLLLRSAYMGNVKIVDIDGNLDNIYAKNVSEVSATNSIESTADFTVTVADGSYYKRKGNICTLGLCGTLLTSSTITIATLPEGYRPFAPIYTYVPTASGVASVIIYGDGTITAYGSANAELRANISFVVA